MDQIIPMTDSLCFRLLANKGTLKRIPDFDNQ